ncbi:kinase-like domain-containing protein [Baffinella frigidus]|nr:kinase-like domain-containing protein [Cryptophyta sp. CCMP2293]
MKSSQPQVIEEDNYAYLVLELASGGNLFERIDSLRRAYTEEEAAAVIRTVLEALLYLHEEGIAHRDVKLENILYMSPDPAEPQIKVADFGMAQYCDKDSVMHTLCGTTASTAPEVLKQGEDGYTPSCDIWSVLYQALRLPSFLVQDKMRSVGVVLYELLFMAPPFSSDNQAEIIRKILKGLRSYPSPYMDTV